MSETIEIAKHLRDSLLGFHDHACQLQQTFTEHGAGMSNAQLLKALLFNYEWQVRALCNASHLSAALVEKMEAVATADEHGNATEGLQ